MLTDEAQGAPTDIVVAPSDDGIAIRVGGELDLADVPFLEAALEAADTVEQLVVDLSETQFVDLRVMTMLVECSARRARDGHRLLVKSPPPSGEVILRSTTLGQRLSWERRTCRRQVREPIDQPVSKR